MYTALREDNCCACNLVLGNVSLNLPVSEGSTFLVTRADIELFTTGEFTIHLSISGGALGAIVKYLRQSGPRGRFWVYAPMSEQYKTDVVARSVPFY